MLKDLLYKTFALTKFNLKKDFKRTCIWLISLIGFTYIIGIYYIGMQMTQVEKNLMIETLQSPAMVLLVGTAPDIIPTTGMMFAVEMTLFSAITVIIMNIFMVTHSTRQDEETGRLEIIRSLPTGRLSTLAAATIQAFIVNLVLALGVGISLGFLDFGSNSFSSGILYGCILGATGFMFAMIGTIFVQLFQSNRTVISACFAFLGLNFVFRGITDISNPSLSWLSPLSWSYKTEVYVNNYWFPVLLMLGISIIMIIISMLLNSKRDLDGSFIKQKPGKSHASKSLLTPFGFTYRLNKTTLLAWIAGIAVLGFTFGSILGDLENFFSSNDRLKLMFPDVSGEAFTKQFISMIACIFSVTIVIPVLTFIGRVYTEEKKNHMENIISKSISRNNLFGSYLIFSLISSIIFVLLAIFSIYAVGYSAVKLKDIFNGMVIFIPTILFMIGLGVFLVGALPKLFVIVWLLAGYGFFISYFAEMLKLSDIFKQISPFYHIQILSVDNLDYMPLIVLTLSGVILTIIGFVCYRKRDITA